jgi:hypothetical protein
MSGRRRIHLAVMVLLTAAIVVIALRMDWRRASATLAELDWRWVLLVPILNVAGVAAEAVRWKLILAGGGRGVPVRSTFAAMLVGIVGNIVLPFKLGDTARAYTLSHQEGVPLSRAVSSVLLDRAADIIPFVALALVTGMFFSFPAGLRLSGGIGVAVLALIVITFVILFRTGRLQGSAHFARVNRMHAQLRSLVSELRDTGRFLRVSVSSFLVWGIRVAVIYTMLAAFALDVPGIAGLVVLIVVTLGIAAVSSPGNVGSFELAAMGALKLFGVETEVALGFAVTLHAVEVVPIAALGLAALWITGIRLRDVVAKPTAPEKTDTGPAYLAR